MVGVNRRSGPALGGISEPVAAVAAVISLLILAAIPSLGQRGGIIEGQVITGVSGRPLVNVPVRLLDQNDAILNVVFTGAGGRFRLEQIPTSPTGALYLGIDLEGFEPVRERLDLRDLGGIHVMYLDPRAPENDGTVADSPLPVDVSQLDIPEEAVERYEEGSDAADAGRHEEAIRDLEAALELAPDYYDAWIKLGVQHMTLRNHEEAEHAFGAAVRSNPSGFLGPLNLGILAYERGQMAAGAGQLEDAQQFYEGARPFLTDAARLNPVSAQAHFYLGATLYELGAYAVAEAQLLDALWFDPSMTNSNLMLINVYVRLNRLEDALRQANSFLEAEPDSPQRPAIESVRSQIEAALRP